MQICIENFFMDCRAFLDLRNREFHFLRNTVQSLNKHFEKWVVNCWIISFALFQTYSWAHTVWIMIAKNIKIEQHFVAEEISIQDAVTTTTLNHRIHICHSLRVGIKLEDHLTKVKIIIPMVQCLIFRQGLQQFPGQFFEILYFLWIFRQRRNVIPWCLFWENAHLDSRIKSCYQTFEFQKI